MEEITPGELSDWLCHPTIVVVPSGNAYAINFVLDALKLEEVFGGGQRLEVRGPLGRGRRIQLWLAGADDGLLMDSLDPGTHPESRTDTQMALDAWYRWEGVRA